MSRDILAPSPLTLVVAAGIEGESAKEFAFPGEDPDVEVGHKEQDPGAGVLSSHSDVVKPAVVPKRDQSVAVDLVLADPVVAGDG
jgi:hypothetical protein